MRVWLSFFAIAACVFAAAPPIPVILDTDIGTDIDDAFALALALSSPELDLRGVTTVSADAYSRARIACRFLESVGRPEIPVAAHFEELRIEVDGQGFTREAAGKPNLRVALAIRADDYLRWFTDRVTKYWKNFPLSGGKVRTDLVTRCVSLALLVGPLVPLAGAQAPLPDYDVLVEVENTAPEKKTGCPW